MFLFGIYMYFVRAELCTHAVHIDSVRVRPSVLVGLDKSVGQQFRNAMKANEFFYTRLLFVIFFCALVQAQHYR